MLGFLDYFFISGLVLTTSISVIANCLVLASLSPKRALLGNYGTILASCSMADLIGCIMTAISMTRVLYIPGRMVLVAYGLCNYWGNGFVCAGACYVMEEMFAVSTMFLLVSFAYRLIAIKAQGPSARTLKFIVFTVHFTIAFPLYFFLTSTEFDRARSIDFLDSVAPLVAREVQLLPFHVTVVEVETCLPSIIYNCASSPLAFMVACVLRSMTLQELERQKGIMSTRTAGVHRMFVKASGEALNVQLLVLSFFGAASVTFVLDYFEIVQSIYQEYSVILIGSFLTAFSPATNLYYIKPCREFIKELLSPCCSIVEEKPSQSLSSAFQTTA